MGEKPKDKLIIEIKGDVIGDDNYIKMLTKKISDAVESTMKFEIGDIVAKIGIDRHVVIDINQAGDLIEVECVKKPHHNFCDVFDREWNIPERYTLIHRPKNPASKEDLQD